MKSLFLNIRVGIRVRGLHLVFCLSDSICLYLSPKHDLPCISHWHKAQVSPSSSKTHRCPLLGHCHAECSQLTCQVPAGDQRAKFGYCLGTKIMEVYTSLLYRLFLRSMLDTENVQTMTSSTLATVAPLKSARPLHRTSRPSRLLPLQLWCLLAWTLCTGTCQV